MYIEKYFVYLDGKNKKKNDPINATKRRQWTHILQYLPIDMA
jgi:hypothetical protein